MEFVKFLFSLPEVKNNHLALLSNHICQDPLENFFGCQRQRGGTSDNPSVNEYFNNTQALRVVNSFCRGPVRGNCRGGASSKSISDTDCAPLQKRQRRSKTIQAPSMRRDGDQTTAASTSAIATENDEGTIIVFVVFYTCIYV